MHITTANHAPLSYQDSNRVIPLSERLAQAGAEDLESGSNPQDFVGDTFRRILRDKFMAMIMGADEEESGIPPLEYEL